MMNFKVQRAAVLLTAIALLLAVTVGGTIAYLMASTDEVVNTFTPTSITTEIEEEFPDGTTKSKVFLTNTGNIPAYIRAKVVITWQDDQGNVHSHIPVSGEDYTIVWGTTGWDKGSDGFWYYKNPVLPLPEGATKDPTKAPEGVTSVLINTCTSKFTGPEGYNLHVEILSQAIQATPASVVERAWDVTVENDGTISK